MSSCSLWKSSLAQRTPNYDKAFLEDFTPLDSPYIGRHETGVWEMGTGDTHLFDTITVGQPNLQNRWQRINAGLNSTGLPDGNGCANSCNPPSAFVAMGSRRDFYYPEQFNLRSNVFCITDLEHQTDPAPQIAEWMKYLKKMPEVYTEDFIRVHAVDLHTEVQICDDRFSTFVPDPTPVTGNITGQLTTIDLGSEAALPQSQLSFPYLDYLTTGLDLAGYHEAPSGLPAGMFNLITGRRDWYNLTNGKPELKDMMALSEPGQASALYKIGQGIQKPFGNYAPTIDVRQLRFARVTGQPGLIQRIEPYINTAATTGVEPLVNPAYVNADIGLSWIWHPMAIKIFTKSFKAINEKVPTVNSALYGSWQFINDRVLMAEQPDGTICTINNEMKNQFYWLVAMYQAFQYKYRKFLMPILHQLDGSGRCKTVNDPVCCAPQYPVYPQYYSNDPVVCED